MKKSRLLGIIREEIEAILKEDTIDLPGDPTKMSAKQKEAAIRTARAASKDTTLGTPKKPVEFVEEDQLNEIPDFGGRYDQQVAAKYGEDQTLDDATKDITDEVLADMGVSREDLKKDADMAAAVLKAIRSKVVGKNQDPRVKKALDKQAEFDDSGNALQANQTNNAILKALGLREPGQRGRKADPNKPEKAPSTGKRGRPSGTRTATIVPGDDGFDDVVYSEPKKEKEEGPKAASSKLDKISDDKDALLKVQRQAQEKMKDLAQKIKSAKAGEKATLMDELKKVNKVKAEVDKKLDSLGY